MRHPRLVAATAVLGFFGVALGAMATHSLKLEGKPSEWWHTGSLYHLFHVLAALAASLLGVARAGWLFLVGIVLFSGSLYLMALTGVTRLGMVTPLGGLCFLAGWGLLALQAIKPMRHE